MAESLKVLQINKLYYPHIGGVEKVVQDIAEGLKSKVDMSVLVCQPRGKGNAEIVRGVKLFRSGSFGICFSMPISFSFPFLLRKLSKDKDILQFHEPFPLGTISYLLMKPKGKVILWWHSDVVKQKKLLRLYSPFLKLFLKKVDKIVIASPLHIKMSSFLKGFEDKCVVIPFGIDINKFQLNGSVNKKIEDIRIKYNDRIVLFVGRLVHYKGVKYLIEAMKEVNAKLILVGEGPLRESLTNLAAKHRVKNKVVFLSEVEDDELSAYYHACDIFVLPSIASNEAFGIVQAEAMACGKPVINTNILTGVPWVSCNGETGITVPPSDTAALARAINLLLRDDGLRREYGRNALKRVYKYFTLTGMIEKVHQVYKEVLESN